MFKEFPHLANLSRAELETLIMDNIASRSKQSDCELWSAAEAAFLIASIEAGWLVAMGAVQQASWGIRSVQDWQREPSWQQ